METGNIQPTHSPGGTNDRLTITEDDVARQAIKYRQTLWQKTEEVASGIIGPRQLSSLRSQEMFQQCRIKENYAKQKVVIQDPAVNLTMEMQRAESEYSSRLEYMRKQIKVLVEQGEIAQNTMTQIEREKHLKKLDEIQDKLKEVREAERMRKAKEEGEKSRQANEDDRFINLLHKLRPSTSNAGPASDTAPKAKDNVATNVNNAAMTLKENKHEVPRGPMPLLVGGPGEEKTASPSLTSMAVGDEDWVDINDDQDSDDELADEEGWSRV